MKFRLNFFGLLLSLHTFRGPAAIRQVWWRLKFCLHPNVVLGEVGYPEVITVLVWSSAAACKMQWWRWASPRCSFWFTQELCAGAFTWSYVHIKQYWFQSSSQGLTLSTAAKHVLRVSALEVQWGVGIVLKYLECLQTAPMLKQRLAADFRHQADASFPAYTSPTHTKVPVCARINLSVLGLVDMLSNASVCRHAWTVW